MDPNPAVQDLRSAAMTHRAGDLFNPPALTNFWGSLQAARDVMGIQHLTFPPYSHGDVDLGMLTVNGCCIATSGPAVTYRWRPDCIEREARVGPLLLRTRTVMGVKSRSAAVRLTILNEGKSAEPVRLRIQTGDGVVFSRDGWKTPYSPREKGSISVTPWTGTPPPEHANSHETLPEGVLYASTTSKAFSLQALSMKPDAIDRSWLDVESSLRPREEKAWDYFVAIGPDPDELRAQFAEWRRDPGAFLGRAEEEWNRELAAVFTPGNDRYSGSLPRLQTRNADLRAVYLNAVLSVVYFKREPPDSAYGRTYTTLMPRYWATTSFINDWSLASWILSLLDPDCVRRHIEMWLLRDINAHFGTEYAGGASAGNWYSCNDYAMARMIGTYVRVTGDRQWLWSVVGGKSILDHLQGIALHYRALDRGHGLGDYGDRNSLLECVGSYVHEVASLNAAAVWILRETAEVLGLAGRTELADDFRRQSSELAPRVRELYVPGKGFWNCRRPDGSLVPVRHAWDFVHTMNFLNGDLPRGQAEEMVSFFERELRTPAWMRALSPLDEDVGFSLRPDHQWNGSYPAWVALAGCALRKAGRMDLLAKWLPGLAKSANQGPYSQAHFAETYAPAEDGGALKAPTEWPYINDWACLSAGAFFETVVDGIFGVDFGLEAISAKPLLAGIDEGAALEGIRHRGERYRVDARGISEVK